MCHFIAFYSVQLHKYQTILYKPAHEIWALFPLSGNKGFSCTPDRDIRDFTLMWKILSYPCCLTNAVTYRLYIGCIGTYAHGRQVTSSVC